MDSFVEPALFGDVLARARQRWIAQMASRLERLGYRDYRRSDAFAMRFLALGPRTLGAFAGPLGSRQASRKVVTGLVERGLAVIEDDPDDARRRVVRLTDLGAAYAKAVTKVIQQLNGELASSVEPAQLAAAISVLRRVAEGT